MRSWAGRLCQYRYSSAFISCRLSYVRTVISIFLILNPNSSVSKRHFNLFGDHGIRQELMNFHATEKPCCSPFTADDPAE
jgi:hypothetical protein